MIERDEPVELQIRNFFPKFRLESRKQKEKRANKKKEKEKNIQSAQKWLV